MRRFLKFKKYEHLIMFALVIIVLISIILAVMPSKSKYVLYDTFQLIIDAAFIESDFIPTTPVPPEIIVTPPGPGEVPDPITFDTGDTALYKDDNGRVYFIIIKDKTTVSWVYDEQTGEYTLDTSKSNSLVEINEVEEHWYSHINGQENTWESFWQTVYMSSGDVLHYHYYISDTEYVRYFVKTDEGWNNPSSPFKDNSKWIEIEQTNIPNVNIAPESENTTGRAISLDLTTTGAAIETSTTTKGAITY